MCASRVSAHIAEASVVACAFDGAHDVVHKAHAVLRAGVKAAHLPVVEACPRAGYGMPCLPKTYLQECVPSCTEHITLWFTAVSSVLLLHCCFFIVAVDA